MRPRFHLLALVAALVPPAAAAAQAPAEVQLPVLTIDRAVQYAIDHYPTVRVALEQVNAATAGIDVARAAYRPRLDGFWQSNRATANNVFGLLLPQPAIPSISGPVLPEATSDSVWGNAAGALFSWEAVDFGLRRSSVAGAEAAVKRARAGEALTRLEVQSAVAGGFLSLVAAQRAVAAAQADVDRREILRRAVQVLVDNQLRPGAEASRADAERAAAQTRLVQARQTVVLAQAGLFRVLGLTEGAVAIASDPLTGMPPEELPRAQTSTHPLVQVHEAAVDQLRAAENILAHTDLPRVLLQSSVFARGSGASTSGSFSSDTSGLGLDRANWAAGVQVIFPNVFDFSGLRARRAAAAASTRSEAALYDEALLTVASQQQAAGAMLEAARAVAASTPLQLAAARQSESQARARFDAGLASLLEVADAQSLLAQAEMQDQLARVDVWRALLAASVAQGDITGFLALVARP